MTLTTKKLNFLFDVKFLNLYFKNKHLVKIFTGCMREQGFPI